MRKRILLSFGLVVIIAASIALGAYAASDIKLWINGKEIKTDIITVNNSNYVPLRIVSESLGVDVKWDGKARTITITAKEDQKSTSEPTEVNIEPSTTTITADDVVQAFKDANLEAAGIREMTKEDYGVAPMTAKEGIRFFIPSLGEDSGGRIFIFDKQSDLEQTKAYYDELGKVSSMLFSWTISHDVVLVQINGQLSEDKYNAYKKALESLK